MFVLKQLVVELIEKIKKNINELMRQNLTKKEIVNSIYMQLGFSKKLIENILEDIFDVY